MSLIAEVTEHLLPVAPEDQIITQLRSILLSGQMSDYYWTDAWLNYTGNPTNEMAHNIVHTRLQIFFQRIFQLSEFHLH